MANLGLNSIVDGLEEVKVSEASSLKSSLSGSAKLELLVCCFCNQGSSELLLDLCKSWTSLAIVFLFQFAPLAGLNNANAHYCLWQRPEVQIPAPSFSFLCPLSSNQFLLPKTWTKTKRLQKACLEPPKRSKKRNKKLQALFICQQIIQLNWTETLPSCSESVSGAFAFKLMGATWIRWTYHATTSYRSSSNLDSLDQLKALAGPLLVATTRK